MTINQNSGIIRAYIKMTKKKLNSIFGLVISAFLVTADVPCLLTQAFPSNKATISVVNDNRGEHLFLNFKLNPDNTILNLTPSLLPEFFLRFFKKGGNNDFLNGFFVIKVPRKKFPIASINSSQYISVIMPETNRDNPQKDKFIAEKKALFDRIVNMVNSGSGEVEVVIDLNRGVLIKNNDPTLLKIDGAEVYFRDINGRYINHSGLYNE